MLYSLAALSLLLAADVDEPRIALLPVVGIQRSTVEARALDEALREAAAGRGSVLVEGAAVQSVLDEAGRMGLSCAWDDAACVAKLGVLAGADRVVAANAREAEGYAELSLVLVDVAKRETLSVVPSWRVLTSEARGEAVALAFGALLRAEGAPGELFVLADRPGAKVVVDGVARGETPLSIPLRDGAAEELTVEVLAEGFAPFRTSVRVAPASQTVVEATLAALTPPDDAAAVAVAADPPPAIAKDAAAVEEAPPYVFFLGTGALGVGLVAGIAAGTGAFAVDGWLHGDEGDRAARAGAQLLGRSLVGVAVGGALVAAGGLVVAGTHWPE